MNTIKQYDYNDVKIVIDERYIAYDQEAVDPDLSFELGTLRSKLPLILYYEDPEGAFVKLEEICQKYGVMTAGAPASQIPLSFNGVKKRGAKLKPGYMLFERFDTMRTDSVEEMRALKNASQNLLVGCSLSSRHALAVANELQLAAGVLVGPTQAESTKRLESIGLSVPRITLVENISHSTDLPVVVTAGSSSDVCKALVAGAWAALIHLGGPFEKDDDLDFYVKSIFNSMSESITELCKSSGAKTARDLFLRCKLVANAD